MASKEQVKAFIAEIAPYAQKAYKALGKVLPSVCIGMACVESAYGTSSIMRKNNAFFGQKVGSGKTATKYWSGKFFTTKTKEEYTVGTHTIIKAAFRGYDSMEQSVFNYYELMNTKLYARVTSGVDFITQMKQIKTCGYMTSSTEVNSVISLINKYNLTQYDNVSGASGAKDKPEGVYHVPTGNIKKGSRGEDVKWLQTMLNVKGYFLKVDGIAGDRTIAAVKDFQRKNGLTVDGIAGKNTITALSK